MPKASEAYCNTPQSLLQNWVLESQQWHLFSKPVCPFQQTFFKNVELLIVLPEIEHMPGGSEQVEAYDLHYSS